MSEQSRPNPYIQAAAAFAKGDELMQAGQITEAYANWRKILDEAELRARQNDSGADEYLAHVHSIWNNRTGLNQSWYRVWPEELRVEMEDQMRQLGSDPDGSE